MYCGWLRARAGAALGAAMWSATLSLAAAAPRDSGCRGGHGKSNKETSLTRARRFSVRPHGLLADADDTPIRPTPASVRVTERDRSNGP